MNTNENKKKKISIKQIILLQVVIMVYTTSGVFAKLASGNSFLSFKFILFYGAEMCILALYALLWQQIIKKVDLSIAYANRAMAIIWSMIWAAVIFNDSITIQNMIGVVIVLIGTMIVNSEHD